MKANDVRLALTIIGWIVSLSPDVMKVIRAWAKGDVTVADIERSLEGSEDLHRQVDLILGPPA